MDFEFSDIAITVAVCMAIVIAANTCFTLYKNIISVSKPSRDIADMLDNDNRRISQQEREIADLKESNRLILKSQTQLLQHAIHGNHTEQMQETYDDIQDFLIRH